MNRLQSIMAWIIWKLFIPIRKYTCLVWESREVKAEYQRFLATSKLLPNPDFPFTIFYGEKLGNKKRREAMWRFLIKGERA